VSDSDDKETPYETLGLSPDATMDQVKSRFRELNDAYLKILQLSKAAVKTNKSTRAALAENNAVQPELQQETSPKHESSPPHQTQTEPISRIKARLAKGEIQKAQFEKLAKERYSYLKSKSFTELSDSEFEERTKGFEGLKFL